MTEENIKTGVVPEIYDSRDYKYSDIGSGSKPFDWGGGYDIEEVLGHSLKVKDQNGSFSCGGQAFSYYGQALQEGLNGDMGERSAKFLYSQCFIPNQGSRGRDLCEIATGEGFGYEMSCSSYEGGKPPTEAFMQRTEDITEYARKQAGNDKALCYSTVNIDINSFARAIRDNYGLCMCIVGQNGKGWLTAFPQKPDKREWGHWMYAGKAKLIDGKRMIGAINSWGDGVGDKGWQWFGEEHFTNCLPVGTDSGPCPIYGAWTISVKKNNDGLIRRILLMLINRLLSEKK